ncbi:cysteine-rich and transmembrane domain-containing protein 1-like [Antechinus flavipes]|uniref:cysteine-rich and transmembrane domain-containing protein 1-like n=1 Tax=Antechinus flavipes TaxID=38775 RepID=UPI0022357663|nr:cysteine-rich and transmembrane domain-containing protein 1-like [Antechinus flavipes]
MLSYARETLFQAQEPADVSAGWSRRSKRQVRPALAWLPQIHRPASEGGSHQQPRLRRRQGFHSPMNPPPYSDTDPTAPNPPQQQPGVSQAYPPPGTYPPASYPPPPGGYPYQGYPQYGWQGGATPSAPKHTVYIVEEKKKNDTGMAACLAACWAALCCCCLWDMLD